MEASHRKFKNIELLRFLLAWAVVGFHLPICFSNSSLDLQFLAPYVNSVPYSAVPFFFLIAFFLLTTGRDKLNGQTIGHFTLKKWLRMAPLIIVFSAPYFIYNHAEFNWAANMENILLIHDWAAYPRMQQALFQSWFCSVYFLIALLFFGLYKTLPSKYLSLTIGVLSYLGWRMYLTNSPEYTLNSPISLTGASNTGLALFCLGIGYALSYACRGASAKHDSKLRRIGFTAMELVTLSVIVCYLFAHQYNRLSLILLILAFAWLLWSFVNRRGYISRFLEKDICSQLGRYAFGIYIVHVPVMNLGSKLLSIPGIGIWGSENPGAFLLGVIATTMILAIISYHLIEKPMAGLYRNH